MRKLATRDLTGRGASGQSIPASLGLGSAPVLEWASIAFPSGNSLAFAEPLHRSALLTEQPSSRRSPNPAVADASAPRCAELPAVVRKQPSINRSSLLWDS